MWLIDWDFHCTLAFHLQDVLMLKLFFFSIFHSRINFRNLWEQLMQLVTLPHSVLIYGTLRRDVTRIIEQAPHDDSTIMRVNHPHNVIKQRCRAKERLQTLFYLLSSFTFLSVDVYVESRYKAMRNVNKIIYAHYSRLMLASWLMKCNQTAALQMARKESRKK